MGFGSYSHEAHVALTRGRGALPREKLFTQRACHALMNPHGVRLRESRDSAAHPASFGVVFALDVTGSMGDIPVMLAKTQLPTFMTSIMDLGVKDPQLLFMAVGDAFSDSAPLQVGQFESGAHEMDRWLMLTYLEGGGGGSNEESYELAMYFAARHTEMDCWVKRQKRGYFIMTGDELPYAQVGKSVVQRIVGDELGEDLAVEKVARALAETYEPFFLIPSLERRARCERKWRDLLGDHVIAMESAEDTCHVASGLVALGEGAAKDLDVLAAKMTAAGVSRDRLGAIVRALTPFAASLGKDGVPKPHLTAPTLGAEDPNDSSYYR
jgi:hypothetical protein